MITKKNMLLCLLIFCFYSCSTNKTIDKNISTPNPKANNIKEIIENNNKVILRDQWGVPHVYGTTDSDAAYSLAYAHAQDDFKTIKEALLKARGTYASVYGPGKDNINAIMDYVVSLLKIWDSINEKYHNELSPETIDLCEGYANGLNAYIEDHGLIEDDIYPISGKDIIAGTMHKTPFFFQLPLFLGDLYFKKPSEIPPYYKRSDEIEKIKGSNVYALSPKITDKGNTILGINSHQPFEGELAWYEAHINSKEGWNMIGGLFPGSPVVLVGHNENLGWGHTVNRPDILDIYELEVNPDDENQYKFNEKWEDFESFEVIIKIKTIGKLKHKHKQMAYWSKHGPVIKGVNSTYAVRYSNMNNLLAIEQWYKMNKANNFKDWKNAIETLSVPMFNTGYADKEGNIYYVYGAKTPKRNTKYDWQKVLPGNTSETLWSDYELFENLPQVLNPKSGFIQNCNSTPFQTTIGPENPSSKNFNSNYGIETHMTNRALRAIETIGKDKKISYDEFINYKFDLNYSDNSIMAFLVKRAISILNENNKSEFDIDLKKQIINTLTKWNLSTERSNIYATLPIIAFNPLLDNSEDEIYDDLIIKRLIYASEYLLKHYNKIDVKWGDVNRIIRGDLNLPLDGGPDIARAIYYKEYKNGQKKAIAGDCYILIANWNKNGKVSSQSIHQYGSSTSNYSSKHFNDQVDIFSNNKLKDTSIYLDDLIKNIESITILDKDIN